MNDRANCRHVHDYHLGGATDQAVYATAIREKRMMITFNTRDYARLVTPTTPSVVALSMQLSTKQIDRKVTALIRRLKPADSLGRLFRISQGTRVDVLIER